MHIHSELWVNYFDKNDETLRDRLVNKYRWLHFLLDIVSLSDDSRIKGR